MSMQRSARLRATPESGKPYWHLLLIFSSLVVGSPAWPALPTVEATLPDSGKTLTGLPMIAVSAPVITAYSPSGCLAKGATFTVQGSHFGKQTGKGLALGGNGVHVDLPVSAWGDTAIQTQLPPDAGLMAGKTYYVGVEKADHSQWLSNINHSFTVCSALGLNPLAPLAPLSTSRLAPAAPTPPAASVPEDSEDYIPEEYSDSSQGTRTPRPSGGSLFNAPLSAAPRASQQSPTTQEADTIEPGEVVVVTGDMASAQKLAQQSRAWGFSVKRRSALASLGLVVSVLRPPQGMSVAQAIESLRNAFPELWLDANHRYQPLAPTDARAYAQTLIGWDPGAQNCGAGLRIGIVDTALDVQHPALRGQKIMQRSFLARGVAPAASQHATATTALLVGQDNHSQIQGLLPGAQVYVAEVFRQRSKREVDTTAEWITAGLDWLVSQRPQVINLGLGGPRNLLVEVAVARVLSLGIPVVAAAGNNGPSAPPVYPAAQEGVVAVTAVDAALKSYAQANRGNYIRLAAPGVDIWTAQAGGNGAYVSGTSYAAPFVTAAMAAQRRTTPKASPQTLIAQLQKNARDLGPKGKDPQYGWGLLQAGGLCGKSPAHKK